MTFCFGSVAPNSWPKIGRHCLQVNLLRVNEVTHVELGPSDTYFDVLGFANFSADFNDYNSIHAENRLALLLTTFSILLLFVGMAVFVVDANKLSRQINEPLNELSQQVRCWLVFVACVLLVGLCPAKFHLMGHLR